MAGTASLALVAGLTLVSSPAAAQESTPGAPGGGAKVEQQVWDELAAEGSTDFWVYLAESADLSAAAGITDRSAQGWFVYEQLTQTAAVSQAGLLEMLDAEGASHRSFWLSNVVQVSGDADLLERIAARPEVAQIAADRVYEIPEPAAATEEARIGNVEWGIARVNAPDVWDEFGVRGEGIVVGSIDTGVEHTHPALVEQYRGNLGGGDFDHNYNWHDPSQICGSPSLVPCDNNGHGTHVTGTMVGDDGGDNQIGVAPQAQWIAAKGCETTGCSQSALLSSGQFITAPTDLNNENADPDMRPHIVNNSWGGGATTDPWYQDTVNGWIAAGIFPQFAAGNPGSACGQAGNPGNLPESYAAGAFDINDNIASFSGRGPSAWGSDIIKPNLSAPGVAVRSSVPGGGYSSFSGTSMASPHVAGVVALMWSAAIALERDIDATRDLLDVTAEDTEDLQCGGTPENNNVWGQGKLDAYAAVDQSPRGPTGTLAGTVTDAETGDPIGGAAVSVTGEADRDAVTAADGSYSFTLPVGDYDVSVSAFGYGAASDSATVNEDETTVLDFELDAVDSVTVSGTVSDGSGHGWALYGQVTVVGTGVSTFTDPMTGAYSLTLPQDATYTFQVSSQIPGYAGHTEEIEVADSDVTFDVALTVENCQAAPGYEFEGAVAIMGDLNNHLANFLDDHGIPSTAITWGDDPTVFDTIIVSRPGNPGADVFQQFLNDTDASGTGVVFLDQWSTLGNGIWLLWQHQGNPATRGTGFSSGIPYLYYEVTQEHPILDGFEVGDEIIFDQSTTFKDHAWFGGYEGEGREVIGLAGRGDTGTVGDGIGVQERDNNRHALLSMHAPTAFIDPSNWTEDGGQIFLNAVGWTASDAGFACEMIDGGLVLGNVYDLNTGEGIVGATVTSDANPADSGTTVATPDDPNLDDGWYWLFSSLTGENDFTANATGFSPETQTVDVAASGNTGADFTLGSGFLVIEPGAVEAELRMGQSTERTFTISNEGTGSATVELNERLGGFEMLGETTVAPQRNPNADPNARSAREAFIGDTASGIAPQAPGDVITSWPTGLGLGWGVGYDGDVWISDVPTANTNTEFTTAGNETGRQHQASWAGSWPGDMAYDEGRGWMCQVNVGGDNGIYCWDPATGDVTDSMTGAPWSNISQRGLAYNPNDDTFYTGGWNEGIVYHVAGFSHPTPGETLSQCSPTDPGIAGLAYNPSAELLWMTNNAATDVIYLLDPSDCTTLDTLAFPDGQGFAGAGLHMDSAGELWLTNQNNNHAYLVESGVPHDVDVPWMDVSPTSFTLDPGESVTVTVALDGDVEQPGTYTAAISISHDTPHDVDPVGVTMVVTPPNNWGKITGTITGTDCTGESVALSGALVQVNGRVDQFTLFTDSDGHYGWWMAANNSPLELIVAASGYVPQVGNERLRPRQETVANFHLTAIC